MGRTGVFAAGLIGVAAAALPALALAQDDPDPKTKLALMAAAFGQAPPPPKPGRVIAMAFLPGRGMVQWDVTGLTPEQAKEAEIEAMGRADADAVQREIDAAAAAPAASPASTPAPSRKLLLAAADGDTKRLRRPTPAAAAPLVKNGDVYKEKPRLYAFAGASGQAVGVNVLHGDAGWTSGGVTADHTALEGQRQAGLAWRAGALQTSLSYLHQKTVTPLVGAETVKDDRVMLTMNLPTNILARALIAH
jgi:hypothetical protein